MTKLSIIIPVYNEAQNINFFLERMIGEINKITGDYEIIFMIHLQMIQKI